MRKSILSIALIIGLFLLAPPVQALKFEYGYVFSGDSPAGSAPWLIATFENLEGEEEEDVVRLTLDTNGLVPGEFIDGQSTDKGWFFNFNPTQDPTALSFDKISGNDADNINTGIDAFKADGDGRYDIVFRWNASKHSRLEAGNVVVYDISGIPGLDESWFNYSSAPDGGAGPFLSAAHVQGIPNADSGWIAPGAPIPEPTTILLLGSGLVGMVGLRRRRLSRE